MNNYKNFKDTQQTDKWLKQNGVNVAHIYVGTAELFQATKLATTTLRDYGQLLAHAQAQILNKFLQATRNYQKRQRITQAQCFTVMNIAKQAQRRSAKLNKHNRQHNE
jgi:hypothetical protein